MKAGIARQPIKRDFESNCLTSGREGDHKPGGGKQPACPAEDLLKVFAKDAQHLQAVHQGPAPGRGHNDNRLYEGFYQPEEL